MQDDYDQLEARELVFEGGLSDNPKDPGGLTNQGITQATYNSWRARQHLAQQSVAHISSVEVSTIYKTDYWDRVDGDELPPGIDFVMFDAAINSGVGGCTEWAQACVGLDADGDFGPKTKAAILAADPETFVKEFCSRRLGTLKRLSTWSSFGRGWSARITNVQKTALAMIQQGDLPDPVMVHTIGGHTKARPSDVPVSKTRVIAAHITTAGAAAGAAAAQAGQELAPASDTFPFVKYVLGGLTMLSAAVGLVVYFGKTADDAAANAQAKAKVDPDADTTVQSVSIKPVPTVTATVVTQQAATTTVIAQAQPETK